MRFSLLRDIFEGIVMGLASNVYLLLDQDKWDEQFGSAQATPITVVEEERLTKVKYVSRTIGAAAFPIALILGIVGLIQQLFV